MVTSEALKNTWHQIESPMCFFKLNRIYLFPNCSIAIDSHIGDSRISSSSHRNG